MERDERMKDKILQEIHDALDQELWGEGYDQVILTLVFEGRLEMKPIEVKHKTKRKPIF
ncbi:MAG: hypothetical protein WDN67_00695 [Candidatus Moraniibacteriota bacterium]